MKNKKDIVNNVNKAKIENKKIEALIPEAEETKKSNAWLFIVIGVLVLIVLIFAGLIAIGTLVYNNTKLDIEDDREEVENELVLTDEVKLAVSTKLYKLLGGKISDNYEATNVYYESNFNSSLLRGELSDEEKQIIALRFTQAEKDETNRWKSQPSLAAIIKKNPKMVGLEYLGTVSYEEYNKVFLELFGTGTVVPKEIVGVCPEYYYSEANNEFYKITYSCGSISYGNYISYISNYKVKDNKVELDIHFGFAEPGYKDKTLIYGNFEEVKQDDHTYLKYVEEVEKIDAELTESYIINDSNKDKFSHYKFTFKNLNDNFIYEKVEKIK